MKIDKSTVDKIAKLNDEALWKVIASLGASSGIDLSGANATPAKMQKIRQALSQMTENDINRAMEILEGLKNGEGDGNGGR